MATCYIKKGNTEIIAKMTAEETKGTLFHIKTETRKTREDEGRWIIA